MGKIIIKQEWVGLEHDSQASAAIEVSCPSGLVGQDDGRVIVHQEGLEPDPVTVETVKDVTGCNVTELTSSLQSGLDVSSNCGHLVKVSNRTDTVCVFQNVHFDAAVPALDSMGIGILAALLLAIGLGALKLKK